MEANDFVKLPLLVLVSQGFSMEDHLFGINIFFFFVNLNSLISIIGQITCLTKSIQSGQDLAIVSNFILTLLYFASMIPKMVTLLSKRKYLKNLLDELDKIMPRSIQDKMDYRVHEFVKSAQRMATIFAIIQLASVQYLSFSATIVSYLSRESHNGTWHFVMPYGEEYPFYVQDSKASPIMFISQVWEGYVGVGTIYSINFFVYGVVVQICMHYAHLAWKAQTFEGIKNNQRADHQHLIWCISHHNQVNG